MTLLEKARELGYDPVLPEGGYKNCPYGLNLESRESSTAFCRGHNCYNCWEREYIEPNTIKDSGERTEFSTGAVRDMHEGKGDMASLPWEAILRLSKHYEAGAKKYDRWNFRKGIPVSSFIDSACRHLAKYQCGCDDEDHLAAAAFNVLGAMLMENIKPEMIDLPLREGKETFNYFEEG